MRLQDSKTRKTRLFKKKPYTRAYLEKFWESRVLRVFASCVAKEGGYDSAWSRFAKGYRQRYPLCAACERQGRVTASEQVDHQIPLSVWTGGKYDETNLQALCSTCHSRKTVYERESCRQGGGGGGPWPLVPRSLAAKEITTTGEWGDVLSGGGGIVADYR